MASNPNPNIEKVDTNQAIVRAFDGDNDATRVIVAGATQFTIELDRADGDSVYAYNPQDSSTGTLLTTSVGGDQLVAPISVVGYKKIMIFGTSLAGVSGAGSVKIQLSPADSGSVWSDFLTFNTSATAGTTLNALTSEFVAKRARVVAATAPTGGNVDLTILLG